MYLTIAEAALILRITKRSAQRLVAAGGLPVVRFSRRTVRVPVAALDRMNNDAIAATTRAKSAEADVPDGEELLSAREGADLREHTAAAS